MTDLNTIVAEYISLRDHRADVKKEFDTKDQELKDQLEQLENKMLSHLHDMGATSIKTDAGTIYKQENITPTGSDWEIFYSWVVANDAFDALEKRIRKTFIKEYMDTHEGSIPPGVSVYREYVARVRRS